MSFIQGQLDDLAQCHTAAWNSKRPENVAAFHTASSHIVINRGERSEGHDGITAMAAGFHAETGNPLHVQGWEERALDADINATSSLGWFDGA